MNELKKLLAEFVANPKKNFKHSEHKSPRDYTKEYGSYDGEKQGPLTYSEATEYRPRKNMFSHVSPLIYNKKIKIDEFELIIQYNKEFEEDSRNETETISYHRKRQYFTWYVGCNVILNYRGVHYILAKYRNDVYISSDYVLPTQTNWSWLKFGPEKPYMLREEIYYEEFMEYEKTKEILNSLDIDEGLFLENNLEFQPWYQHSGNYKTLVQYTLEQIDSEWFIKNEIKDGVYKPEKATIDEIISRYSKAFKEDLLVKLGVHTIQLRTTSHFPVANYFTIPNGCVIKAAKSIITTYGYEKYCNDTKLIKEIKNDKEEAKRKYEEEVYRNQFTLMQHGKELLVDKDRNEIIRFLENFISKSVESTVIDQIQPLFDKFNIDKFYLGYYGVYSEYESRGHRCDYNEEVENLNSKIIDDEILDKIYSLHLESIPTLSEREIELAYGLPDMGIQLLGVKKNKNGKLETFVEDYKNF